MLLSTYCLPVMPDDTFVISFFTKDIDECKTGAHSCDQICTNTVGSYRCACVQGYTLLEDGLSCAGTYSMYVCAHVFDLITLTSGSHPIANTAYYISLRNPNQCDEPMQYSLL